MAFDGGSEAKLPSPFWEKRFRPGVYALALSVSAILVKMYFPPYSGLKYSIPWLHYGLTPPHLCYVM